MKIASWNVNGIRSCSQKGFLDWLNQEMPDVVCLQETRAAPNQFPQELLAHKQYTLYTATADKKGYSGVAILVKKSSTLPLNVKEQIGIKKFDCEGRTIVLEFPRFFLFCCYFPNGGRDHERVPYKLDYSNKILSLSKKLKRSHKKEIIVCGDFNTAHQEIDLKNPKSNINSTGFLPKERQWITKFITQGFHDIFREQHLDEAGHYTWWSYRGDCRKRNIGWRLDYFFVTTALRDSIIKSYHSPEVTGSDHCPVILEVKIQ